MYDFFSDFFSDGFDIFVPGGNVTQQNVCKSCGMSVSEFMRTGKLGCPVCYQEFEPQILQVLKRIHGNTTHVGKLPKGVSTKLMHKREVQSLRTQLCEAVSKEDFETAAVLRDKLREMGEGGDAK